MNYDHVWKCLGLAFLVTALVVGTEGCGPGGPAVGQVEGTVTLDGEPVAGAIVTFVPVEGGRNSMAETDESGHYVLEYTGGKPGALVGKHKVRISTYQEPEEDDSGQLVGGVPEKIPAKYNEQTTLEVEVKRGKQTIDFELTSD